MLPNPVLKKLGYTNNDRLVIFHADDVGMCQASLSAYKDLVSYGLLSSAATMVPCPWFTATAVYCRRNQGSLPIDMGVHLTLTSEWESYRWGPVSSVDPDDGLTDGDGFFYATSEAVQAHADGAVVLRESDAQVERAVTAGVDITHLDSHMGACFHPKFLAGYVQIAVKHRIPALLFRKDEADMKALASREGLPAGLVAVYMEQMEALEGQGWPLLDNIQMLSLEMPDNRLQQAQEAIDALPAGITHFIVHPAQDTPELRAITPDWRGRVADYQLFISDAWRDVVERSGIIVIGYRHLRDLIRSDDEELQRPRWSLTLNVDDLD